MRKIFIKIETGYLGEDSAEVFLISSGASNREIDDYCWELACEHAQIYDHELDEFEEEFADVSGDWCDYVPKEHDMYRAGGGSFEEDFI